jgi:hypothetical protein
MPKGKVKAAERKTLDVQAGDAKPAIEDTTNEQALADRAAALELIASDRADAMRDYQLAQRAQLENMARLRAMRLAAQAAH